MISTQLITLIYLVIFSHRRSTTVPLKTYPFMFRNRLQIRFQIQREDIRFKEGKEEVSFFDSKVML